MSSCAVRVSFAKNTNRKDSRAVILKISPSLTLEDLLKQGGQKLKLKAKRLFLASGVEVSPSDNLVQVLGNDTLLLFSAGEEFVGTATSTSSSLLSSPDSSSRPPCIVSILSDKSITEEAAVKQLNETAKLQGLAFAVGMPDLHAGNRFPIGATFASVGIIYPPLIGGDIGCGMAVYRTDLSSRSINIGKWSKRLDADLEGGYKGDASSFFQKYYAAPTPFDATTLGTIGGGNHFAELQVVDKVFLQQDFESLGLSEEFLVLLVHSGSRALGQHVLGQFREKGKDDEGIKEEDASEYLKAHNDACSWAKCNRAIIAHRFMEAIGTSGTPVIDIWHNSVEQKTFSSDGKTYWLHRKGAAPSDRGLIVIPGSRGAITYLVKPVGEQEKSCFSLAHGAGRKWPRSKARETNMQRFPQAESLTKTDLGSCVICEDRTLLYEEHPNAYKEIEDIIADLEGSGLIQVVATLKPVITYKTRASHADE